MGNERYVLMDCCPNNAILRHWGILDTKTDEYADTPEHGFCYGLTLAEARKALARLEGEQDGR